MCFLPSASKALGEAVGIEKPYDASIANNLFGEAMGNADYQKKPVVDPVIERQAYVSPVPRSSSSSSKRRRIAGMETSSQGVLGPASTTANPLPVGGG